jgi:serine/threonine-protein kinase
VVFVGRDSKGSSLYLQDLVSGDLKRLPETRHAAAPAFSPDDRAVGFITGSAIKVLNLEGGLPRDIAQAETDREQWAWSGPGHVVFTSGSGLSRVSVNGGAPEAIATLAAGETRFLNPFALPGGAYLVSVLTGGNTDDASRVAVVVPGESTRLIVAERGGSPAFAAGSEPGVGHIVFAEADRLMAIPFDANRRVVEGNAVPIVENVAMRPNGDRAEYTVSTTGTLIFREGSLHELVWIDRGTGTVRPLSANLRRFALPRLSPDGSRLAMEMQDSPHQIWMLDIERDALVPLTTESAGSHNFAWAPDGQSLAYTRGDRTATQLGLIRADGSGTVEKIDIAAKGWVLVEDWSRDGRLALMLGAPTPAIMTVRLDRASPPKAPGAPVRVADGSPGSFSPDGSWLAYCDCTFSADRPSNVFIQHLESGARHQVSTNGGWQPLWADSGRELFFRSGTKMMAVPVTIDGASARLGRAQVIFEGDYLDWGQPNYDVTADGKQFVMVRTVSANARTLSVRLNWLTELERLSPAQR